VPEHIFAVTGLHCGGCANRVSQALGSLPTVGAVAVELATGGPSTVRVQADAELRVEDVQAALANEGQFVVTLG
jgi:copper chaperone CopZ